MSQSISYPQEFPLQIHRLAAFSFHQFSAIVPAPRYISSSSVSPPLFPLPSIPPSSIYPFFVLSSLSALTRSAFAFFPVPVPVSSWLLVFFLITANSGSPFIYSLPAIDAPFANLSFRSLPSSLIYTTPASCAPILDYTFIPTTFFPSTHFAYKKLRCRRVEGVVFPFRVSFFTFYYEFFSTTRISVNSQVLSFR